MTINFDNMEEAMNAAKKNLPPETTIDYITVHKDTLDEFGKRFSRPKGKNPRFHNTKINISDNAHFGKVYIHKSDGSIRIVNLMDRG